MKLKYHKTLTEQKWASFPFYKQILMIANELNRANYWIKNNDVSEVKLCYERALELVYLTITTLNERRRLKELLRFKEILASFYIKPKISYKENNDLLKLLLLFDRNSFLLLQKDKSIN
jgi:hypothetical protein